MRIPSFFLKLTSSVLLLIALFLNPALASGNFVLKQSNYSVGITLDRLTKMLNAKGIRIFARVDHSAGAKKIGLALRPTQVLIFGNPKLGTPLMLADQRIGLALPLKVLVFQDADGKVWLTYRKAEALKQRYKISSRDKVFAKIKGALAKLTDKAVQSSNY